MHFFASFINFVVFRDLVFSANCREEHRTMASIPSTLVRGNTDLISRTVCFSEAPLCRVRLSKSLCTSRRLLSKRRRHLHHPVRSKECLYEGDLVEVPFNTADTTITTWNDGVEQCIRAVDGSARATHALVAHGGLDSGA